MEPRRRTKTRVGLGDDGSLGSAPGEGGEASTPSAAPPPSMQVTRGSGQGVRVPEPQKKSASRTTIREEPEDDPPEARPSDRPRKTTVTWTNDEGPTGTRRRPSSGGPPSGRPNANAVDRVGASAVKLARSGKFLKAVPRPVGGNKDVSKAPIDHRAAFVLSLVDGVNDTDAIVDASAMRAEEVGEILQRLGRLGLITLT